MIYLYIGDIHHFLKICAKTIQTIEQMTYTIEEHHISRNIKKNEHDNKYANIS